MEMLGFIAFPSIVIICYAIGFICKSFKIEKLDQFIPDICCLVGVILGVVIFLTIPDFIPATNWIEAVCVGIVSGFAATGINQAVKQIKNN